MQEHEHEHEHEHGGQRERYGEGTHGGHVFELERVFFADRDVVHSFHCILGRDAPTGLLMAWELTWVGTEVGGVETGRSGSGS